MPFSADTSLLTGYEGPQITPLTKRMSDILTLADLMDKQKTAARADRLRQQQIEQAQAEMAARNAPLPAEPVEPTAQAIKPEDIFQSIRGKEPIPSNGGAPGVYMNAPPTSLRTPAEQRMLSEGIKSRYGVDITPDQVAQVQGAMPKTVYGNYGTIQSPTEREPAMTQEQFAQLPQFNQGNKPVLPSPESQLGQIQASKQEDYLKLAGEYEAAKVKKTELPKGSQWMTPEEYDHYLQSMTIDPTYAQDYRKELMDQKYKQAQIGKLEAEAAKEGKDKTIKETILKHDRITNMIRTLNPADGVEPNPSDIQARWPGIVKQARSYGIGEELLPTQYDKTAADNFVSETNALKASTKTDPQFQQEYKLRGEFADKSKSYLTVRDAYRAIRENPGSSPADQMALIYQFMKSNDPGSTVRESEFGMAAASGSLGTKIQNAVSQVMTGNRLTDAQVKEFKSTAGKNFESYKKSWETNKNYYNKVASNYDLDPENITGGMDLPEAKTEKPAIRSVKDEQALNWARSNPNDPRAQTILQHLGAK